MTSSTSDHWGDRFVILRMDSSVKRKGPGYKAIINTGQELRMREELAEAVAGVLEQLLFGAATRPTPRETKRLLAAADLVTLCRTGVDYDYRGNVIDAHAPEMPTRLAKQLVQVLRGACAIGMPRAEALRLALRCARDSMPPLRLAILEDVASHPHGRTRDIRQRLNKPYNTVDRQLQAFHMLGVLDCEEVEMGEDRNGRSRSTWYYSVAKAINPRAISIPDLLPHRDLGSKGIATHKSGTEKDRGNTA